MDKKPILSKPKDIKKKYSLKSLKNPIRFGDAGIPIITMEDL